MTGPLDRNRTTGVFCSAFLSRNSIRTKNYDTFSVFLFTLNQTSTATTTKKEDEDDEQGETNPEFKKKSKSFRLISPVGFFLPNFVTRYFSFSLFRVSLTTDPFFSVLIAEIKIESPFISLLLDQLVSQFRYFFFIEKKRFFSTLEFVSHRFFFLNWWPIFNFITEIKRTPRHFIRASPCDQLLPSDFSSEKRTHPRNRNCFISILFWERLKKKLVFGREPTRKEEDSFVSWFSSFLRKKMTKLPCWTTPKIKKNNEFHYCPVASLGKLVCCLQLTLRIQLFLHNLFRSGTDVCNVVVIFFTEFDYRNRSFRIGSKYLAISLDFNEFP